MRLHRACFTAIALSSLDFPALTDAFDLSVIPYTDQMYHPNGFFALHSPDPDGVSLTSLTVPTVYL